MRRRDPQGHRVPHRPADQVRARHARAGRLADRRRSTLRPPPPGGSSSPGASARPRRDSGARPTTPIRPPITVGLATVAVTATADPPRAHAPADATTITVKAVTRSRRARAQRQRLRPRARAPEHQETGRSDAAQRTRLLAYRTTPKWTEPHVPAPRHGRTVALRAHRCGHRRRARRRRPHASGTGRAPRPLRRGPRAALHGLRESERRRPESNWCARLCRPLPNHSATAPWPRAW